MKRIKILIFILIIASFTGCSNKTRQSGEQTNENTDAPEFVFQEEFHNFGSLQAGELVSYSFCLKNTGTNKIKVENAETDCGCLTAEYPEEEILPGDSAFVDVLFNSSGETGKVYKEIAVTINAVHKQQVKLSIAALVKNELINIYSTN